MNRAYERWERALWPLKSDVLGQPYVLQTHLIAPKCRSHIKVTVKELVGTLHFKKRSYICWQKMGQCIAILSRNRVYDGRLYQIPQIIPTENWLQEWKKGHNRRFVWKGLWITCVQIYRGKDVYEGYHKEQWKTKHVVSLRNPLTASQRTGRAENYKHVNINRP